LRGFENKRENGPEEFGIEMEIIKKGFHDHVAERHVFLFNPFLSAIRTEQIVRAQESTAIQAGARDMTRFWRWKSGGFSSEKTFHMPNVRIMERNHLLLLKF